MRKNIVSVVFGILLMGSFSFAAGPKLPVSFSFTPGLYQITIWEKGHFGISSGENNIGLLWPWPFRTEDNKMDTLKEISASYEKEGEKRIITVRGSTLGYLFVEKFNCSPTEVKITYSLESKKKLEKCFPTFVIPAGNIANKEYEWGPELDVPEERGVISAEKIKVDSSPKYFKFFNLDGRDVTLSFPDAAKVEVKPLQWHRYAKGDLKHCCIIFMIYPKGMEKGKSIESGTKSKVQIIFSFTPRPGLKIEKGLIDNFEKGKLNWSRYGGAEISLDKPGAKNSKYCLKISINLKEKSYWGIIKRFLSPAKDSHTFRCWAKSDGEIEEFGFWLWEEDGSRFSGTINNLTSNWKEYIFDLQDLKYYPGPYKNSKEKPKDFSHVTRIQIHRVSRDTTSGKYTIWVDEMRIE